MKQIGAGENLTRAEVPSRDRCRFKLRLVPWLTDSCVLFLNNLFKWLPAVMQGNLTALEFGGGNTTLYFLQKGIKVVTVESDERFISLLQEIAGGLGYTSTTVDAADFGAQLLEQHDLIVLKASSIAETDEIIAKLNWTIIMNDGISRKLVVEEIIRCKSNSIIVLENIKYCANWGRLNRSIAKPDLIKTYRSILRSPEWQHLIFEQGEGRSGHGAADFSGWESPHRWASAVLWPNHHVLRKL